MDVSMCSKIIWPFQQKYTLQRLVEDSGLLGLIEKPRCPCCRNAWLLPPLQELLPAMHARLTSAWARMAPSTKPATEAAAEAEQEIIEEFLLRELTQQYLSFLDLLLRSPGMSLPLTAGPKPLARFRDA